MIGINQLHHRFWSKQGAVGSLLCSLAAEDQVLFDTPGTGFGVRHRIDPKQNLLRRTCGGLALLTNLCIQPM